MRSRADEREEEHEREKNRWGCSSRKAKKNSSGAPVLLDSRVPRVRTERQCLDALDRKGCRETKSEGERARKSAQTG